MLNCSLWTLESGCIWDPWLLSHFSRVQLCVTPYMAAHQAPPSLGFSRQEHWSGLPFPSPMHESEKWKWRSSVMSDSSQPHGLQPTRLLRPWDFPGKSTGVGCHYLTVARGFHIPLSMNLLVCTSPVASRTPWPVASSQSLPSLPYMT